MKYAKRFTLLTLALGLLACPFTAFGAPTIVEPGRTGSLTIQSVAAEDPGQQGAPATGEEVDASDWDPLANIYYTVTRVEDDAQSPAEATPVTGEGQFEATKPTNGEGQAVFSDLPQGLYRVRQEENASLQARVEDFLVSIPTTNPAGNGWIYDIYVYPKYQVTGIPAIDAYVTAPGKRSDSLDLLGTARWILASDVPADIGSAESYQIHCTLHPYLTYAGDVSVQAEREGAAAVALTPSVDYTANEEASIVTITLTADGRKKLGDAGQNPSAMTLYSSFATTLEIAAEDLQGALAKPIGIDGGISYTGALGYPSSSPFHTPAPYVYTGGFGIRQYQGNGTQPLQGARFQLYRSLEDAQAGVGAITAPGSSEAWTAVTDEDGAATFYGLAYGDSDIADSGSTAYYLVQTQVPAGYNLLREPVEVAVNTASHLEENHVVVRGRTGFLLPATGGMGTVWFTVIGLAVIGLAVFLYIRSRRRGRRQASDR